METWCVFCLLCFTLQTSFYKVKINKYLCETPERLSGLENDTRASIDVEAMGAISVLGELSL